MSRERPIEERIVDVLRDAPDDSASTATIRGRPAREEGIRPADEDVQAETAVLVEDGRVVAVPSNDDDQRSRLGGFGAFRIVGWRIRGTEDRRLVGETCRRGGDDADLPTSTARRPGAEP